jgi:ArsR family metal-binding transcriptional regulator
MPILRSFLRIETSLPPCHPGEVEWVKAEAELTDDVSPVLPYLNAIMKGTIYDPENKVLNFKMGGRGITLYARKVVVTRLKDQRDVEDVLEKLRNLINRVWEQRDKIKPSYKTRAKITALDIHKHLPKTNCGACGASTCLAFALKIIGESASIQDCNVLFHPEYKSEREKLFSLLTEAGYVCKNQGAEDGVSFKEERRRG